MASSLLNARGLHLLCFIGKIKSFANEWTRTARADLERYAVRYGKMFIPAHFAFFAPSDTILFWQPENIQIRAHIETGTFVSSIIPKLQILTFLSWSSRLESPYVFWYRYRKEDRPNDFHPIDNKRIVSLGQEYKAMVSHSLGFTNQTLYLMPHFFIEPPVSLNWETSYQPNIITLMSWAEH